MARLVSACAGLVLQIRLLRREKSTYDGGSRSRSGSPFSNASICLDERCAEGKEKEGLEDDGGGALEKRVFIRFYYYLH